MRLGTFFACFTLAAAMASTASACRVPATPERLAAAYEAQLGNADQIITGDVSAILIEAHAAYGVELENVRALRGAAASEVVVAGELVITCMPNFTAELTRIDFEPVLVLLRDGHPLSIHKIESPFARSVIERLQAAAP